MTKIRIGDLYKVLPGKHDECERFADNSEKDPGAYIKVTNINSNGDLEYDILDSGGEVQDNCSECFKAEHLALYKKNGSKPKYVVIWENTDEDPHRYCFDLEEARAFAFALVKKNNTIEDSIRVIEIKSITKPYVAVTLKTINK